MSSKDLKRIVKFLPKSSGVYEFRDKKGKILYIGKATSLKDRVGSYFRGFKGLTLAAAKVKPWNSRIANMVSEITDIKIHKTDSVLEALILESNLIKKRQPKYNVEGKDDKSFAYVVITREKFPRVLVVRETDLIKFSILKFHQSSAFPFRLQSSRNSSKPSFFKTFGPYTSKKQLEIALKLIRKIFPYHSAKQISRNCCFEYQIGLCPGPYAGAISKNDYLKNIHGIKMILQGRKKKLLTELEKQMREYSHRNEFEKAAESRNRIFALKHIRDVALITCDEKFKIQNSKFKIPRIEAYDISNIGGDFATGAMVVFAGNVSDKSQYRKFEIRTVAGIDDIGMMREMLRRRFQNNWPLPDLIFVDGGKGHLNMAQNVVAEFGHNIPVVGVAKGPTRKISNFKFQISNQFQMPKDQKLKNIIDNKLLVANIMGEAHRFAISYHKNLRRKKWRDN